MSYNLSIQPVEMPKPPEKTGSTAVRPIAPPPLLQHLRELAARPARGLCSRNLIPVLGIYGFGWSAALAVFNYWFGGLSALAAIVAALIPRALRATQPKSSGAMSVAANIVRGMVTWIFLVAIASVIFLPVFPRRSHDCDHIVLL
jgi:hypothetical protein